jgi:hypothetical protein
LLLHQLQLRLVTRFHHVLAVRLTQAGLVVNHLTYARHQLTKFGAPDRKTADGAAQKTFMVSPQCGHFALGRSGPILSAPVCVSRACAPLMEKHF